MAEAIRLQKYFTDCGVLSRRAAEAEIAAGRVRVNGTIAQIGDKIDPDVDRVEWKGKPILPPSSSKHVYVMLYKPRGYVTTAKDEKGRPTVTELVSGVGTRVYPVGRLDMDSEGLLLLTNDGEFTNHLTHPRHDVPKKYHVTVSPALTTAHLTTLSSPMEIDGYRLRPVTVFKRGDHELEMHLYEGRNRQIRKMCETVGLKVKSLCRVAIGEVTVGKLECGKWRYLTDAEVRYLMPNHQTERKG